MTLTLADARASVLDHLDDDGTRWSTAQIDRALSLSLVQCVDDYVASGGERFDRVGMFTSAADGTLSLASTPLTAVRAVSVKQGNRLDPVFPRRIEEIDLNDQAARLLQIKYARSFSLQTDPTLPLVYDPSTSSSPSWDTFDHWVCVRAALFASTKDAEARPEIAALEQKFAGSIATMARTPKALPFPRQPRIFGVILAWSWNPDTKTIILSRRLWA